MLVLSILTFSFIVLFYYYIIKPMFYWKQRGIIHRPALWTIGDNLNMFLRKESFAELTMKCYNQFKDERYAGSYQFTSPVLIIREPDLIKQITVKSFDHFTDHHVIFDETVDPLFCKNLFTLKGQKWREMRSILSPSFTSSKMRTIFTLMMESVDTFIRHFVEKNDKIFHVEMKDIFTRFGNDVIASTAFGVEVNSFDDRNNEFYLMGKEITEMTGFWKTLKAFGYLTMPKVMQLLKVRMFNQEATNFFCRLIKETIIERENKNIVRPDMIQLLIEARKGKVKSNEKVVETGFATVKEFNIEDENKIGKITNEDIAAQAMIFFFAGFESVTTLMSFMAYELAINVDVQDKLREEIMETRVMCNDNLTYEALMKMNYMDMVVSESLRKWPAIVGTDRICTKSFNIAPETPEEKPFEIEKGMYIFLSFLGIHRDPKFYPEPDKFNPERFNKENKLKINPYAYMPFGLGPRSCIASRFALMEIKALFYCLLLNFQIIPTEKTTIPAKLSTTVFNLSLEGGFHLDLKRIR